MLLSQVSEYNDLTYTSVNQRGERMQVNGAVEFGPGKRVDRCL
jgi:hypothetical protein